MESDVGTLLFVASLLGAGSLGLFYYGTEGNSDTNDSAEDEEKGVLDVKEDELEELDDSFFGSVTKTKSHAKKLNTNSISNISNKSRKNGRRVRFNTRRRY
jgi:hypothetical protein